MIYITGDTHGDIGRLSRKNMRVGDDYDHISHVIILGDFGMIWSGQPTKEEQWWFDWVKEAPFELLFLGGNHENWERLYSYPEERRYKGLVRKINDSIYMLQHGQAYEIEDKSFFVFGGADSIDKEHRVDRVSWWQEEIPTYADFHRAMETGENHNWTFDYVLTHTAPHEAINEMDRLSPETIWDGKDYYELKGGDPTTKMLDEFAPKMICKEWYFGHFHQNRSFKVRNINYHVLFEHMVRLP